MPLQTKIVLSGKELALIKNKEWILTKQAALQKVQALFNECIPVIDTYFRTVMEKQLGSAAVFPKISQGENYLGLPYITLDHPRIFGREDIFAVRTMFWWGSFVSVTLHVSGKYKTAFSEIIKQRMIEAPAGLYLCVHAEQWHHHFEKDNYLPADSLPADIADRIFRKPFIKLALQFSLGDINNIPELLEGGYKRISKLLN